MIRPRVFIGSATPRLTIASALQARLQQDFLVTIWDQGVFRPSQYPLPSLLQRCKETDFAIQIVAPDVIQKDSDGKDVFAPNPNVLIELGLFMGALGQQRVFLVAPSTFANIKMPSDLQGLTVVPYDADREDSNWDAAVGPTAHKIRQEIELQWPTILREGLPWHRVVMFQNLSEQFRELVQNATEFKSCYIHSRRWRENYGDDLRRRMRDGALTSATFYLPDVRDGKFITDLASRFDDAPSIPAMILDAYRWVESFAKEFDGRITFAIFPKIPTYSFYIFQSVGIIANYNLATRRKPVPAIEARKGDEVWDYMMRDLGDFHCECAIISFSDIDRIATSFRDEFHIGVA